MVGYNFETRSQNQKIYTEYFIRKPINPRTAQSHYGIEDLLCATETTNCELFTKFSDPVCTAQHSLDKVNCTTLQVVIR